MSGDYVVDFWPGNRLSYTTTCIRLYRNDIFLSFATGFCLKFGKAYGLVTNYHVLSGINPATEMLLSPTGAIPNRIEFHIAVETEWYEGGKRHEELFFKPLSIFLEDEEGLPVWFDDRTTRKLNDYAILRLEPYISELLEPGVTLRSILGGRVALKKGANHPSPGNLKLRHDEVQHFYPPVGERVFVLGYPQGTTSTGVFPIWKGATIASEPFAAVAFEDVNYDNVFYIDATTKSGMSGSPVVALGSDNSQYFTEDGISIKGKTGEDLLLGVYAGRDGVTKSEYEMSLGRVWKTSSLEALFVSTIGKIAPIEPRPPRNTDNDVTI